MGKETIKVPATYSMDNADVIASAISSGKNKVVLETIKNEEVENEGLKTIIFFANLDKDGEKQVFSHSISKLDLIFESDDLNFKNGLAHPTKSSSDCNIVFRYYSLYYAFAFCAKPLPNDYPLIAKGNRVAYTNTLFYAKIVFDNILLKFIVENDGVEQTDLEKLDKFTNIILDLINNVTKAEKFNITEGGKLVPVELKFGNELSIIISDDMTDKKNKYHKLNTSQLNRLTKVGGAPITSIITGIGEDRPFPFDFSNGTLYKFSAERDCQYEKSLAKALAEETVLKDLEDNAIRAAENAPKTENSEDEKASSDDIQNA